MTIWRIIRNQPSQQGKIMALVYMSASLAYWYFYNMCHIMLTLHLMTWLSYQEVEGMVVELQTSQ